MVLSLCAYGHRSCVPMRRLHPPNAAFEGRLAAFEGRLRHSGATKAVPIQTLHPSKAAFEGRLRHSSAKKAVPIQTLHAWKADCVTAARRRLPQFGMSFKCDPKCALRFLGKRSVQKWTLRGLPFPRIHSAPVTTQVY